MLGLEATSTCERKLVILREDTSSAPNQGTSLVKLQESWLFLYEALFEKKSINEEYALGHRQQQPQGLTSRQFILKTHPDKSRVDSLEENQPHPPTFWPGSE